MLLSQSYCNPITYHSTIVFFFLRAVWIFIPWQGMFCYPTKSQLYLQFWEFQILRLSKFKKIEKSVYFHWNFEKFPGNLQIQFCMKKSRVFPGRETGNLSRRESNFPGLQKSWETGNFQPISMRNSWNSWEILNLLIFFWSAFWLLFCNNIVQNIKFDY